MGPPYGHEMTFVPSTIQSSLPTPDSGVLRANGSGEHRHQPVRRVAGPPRRPDVN